MVEHLRPGYDGTGRTLLRRRFRGATLAVAMLGGFSCAELQTDALQLDVQYSGGRLLRPTTPSSMVVLRTDRPNRRYADMGTVSRYLSHRDQTDVRWCRARRWVYVR